MASIRKARFFGSKTYHILGTAVQTLPLMEHSTLLADSTVSAVIGNRPVADTILANYVANGRGLQARQYYSYGASKFTNGLIEGTLGIEAIPVERIKEIIISEVGTLPEGDEIVVYIPEVLQVSEDTLAREWVVTNKPNWVIGDVVGSLGYFPLTGAPREYWTGDAKVNKIPNPDPATVDKFPDVVEVTFSICNVSRSPQYNQYGGVIGWNINPFLFVPFKFLMPVEYQYDTEDVVYICKYKIGNDIDGWTEHTWIYNTSEGTYPDIDPEIYESEDNQHLPIVPIRLDNKSMVSGNGVVDTPLYKTSRVMLNKFTVNIGEVGKGIDDNPDVADIDHCYFVIAPKITTTSESTSEYLFKYFQDLYIKAYSDTYPKYKQAIDIFDQSSAVEGTADIPAIQRNVIELRDKESHFVADLAFTYIRLTTYKGKLANKQKYAHLTNTSKPTYCHYLASGTLIVKYQSEDDTITQLEIAGISYTQLIWRAWGDKGDSPWFNANLNADKDENNFLIPINLSIVEQMSLITADEFIQESIQLVVQSWEVQKQKVKWYQTGFFKIFTTIISAVFAVFTGQIYLLLATLTITTVFQDLVAKIFKVFVGALGEDLAIILAATTAITGAAIGIAGVDSLLLGVPLATAFSFISTGIFSGISAEIAEDIADTQAQQAAFEKESKDKMEELEEVWKELNPPTLLDPTQLLAQVDLLGYESATGYVDRKTINDIAYLPIEAVYQYTDIALTTPLDLWEA